MGSNEGSSSKMSKTTNTTTTTSTTIPKHVVVNRIREIVDVLEDTSTNCISTTIFNKHKEKEEEEEEKNRRIRRHVELL